VGTEQNDIALAPTKRNLTGGGEEGFNYAVLQQERQKKTHTGAQNRMI
jgi:hypothetical protein